MYYYKVEEFKEIFDNSDLTLPFIYTIPIIFSRFYLINEEISETTYKSTSRSTRRSPYITFKRAVFGR